MKTKLHIKTKWFQQTYLRSTKDEELASLLALEVSDKHAPSDLAKISH